MNLLAWFRRAPDPEVPVVKQEIEREVSKLNGATERLTTLVEAIVVQTQTDREQSRQSFLKMLDDVVQAPNKEARK